MRRFLLLVLPVLVACSSEGPTGPKGDPGPQGEPGAPGMPGTNAVAKSYSVTAEVMGTGISTMPTPITTTAKCDAGDVATSGMCQRTLGPPLYPTSTTDLLLGGPVVAPPDPATGWRCDYDKGADGVTITATVLCTSAD